MDKSKYDIFIGKVLDNRYKILELVGIGGMAFVLKATDLVMNRTVAIKILNEEFNGDEQAEQRFINESKAVAMLSHKNIVNIYDVAIYADMKYIVMEYLDGITLKEYLTRKEKLEWKEAAFYICQILRALDHAHSKGIVHRDIKPQNIMLLKSGEIKVTDFGIAKVPNTEPLTMTDKAIGTVYYISPEQASGKETGFYSDIYSVGVMLYEAVTGVLPFVATSPVTVAMMQVSDAPKDPSEHVPELPKAIVLAILKAMEKQPESRFKSAHSMARVLEEIVLNPEYEFKAEEEFDDFNNTGTIMLEQIQPDAEEFQSREDMEYAEAQRKVSERLAARDMLDEQEKRKKKQGAFSGGGLLPIVAAVTFAFILALVGAGVAVGYQVFAELFSNESQKIVIEIPNLVEQVWNEELEESLLKQKIKLKIQYDNSDHEERDVILRQSPTGGVKRNLTSSIEYIEVIVNLSIGKKDIIVPDVTITEYREARTKLDQLGLVVIEYEYFSPTILAGYVISTEPAAGATLKNGDTIKLFKSKGQDVKKVSVPSLLNKELDDARRTLATYHLILGRIDEEVTDDKEKDGLISSQSIIPSSMVNEYSTVIDIKVFRYEEPIDEDPDDDPDDDDPDDDDEIIIEP